MIGQGDYQDPLEKVDVFPHTVEGKLSIADLRYNEATGLPNTIWLDLFMEGYPYPAMLEMVDDIAATHDVEREGIALVTLERKTESVPKGMQHLVYNVLSVKWLNDGKCT